MPFLVSGRGPEVVGKVMLDELPGVIGQHLAVVASLLGFFEVEVVLFGSIDDGRQRYALMVL